MKLLFFKFTVVKLNEKTPSTLYVEAPNQEIGKAELAKELGVDPNIIRWNNKNIPFETRKKLADKNNEEFKIFLSVRKKEIDLTKSIKKTLLNKIDKLFKDDESLLSLYNDNRYSAYKDIREQLIKNDIADDTISPGITILDKLDGYLANQSESLQRQFNEG